jgi:hypothetical protein
MVALEFVVRSLHQELLVVLNVKDGNSPEFISTKRGVLDSRVHHLGGMRKETDLKRRVGKR